MTPTECERPGCANNAFGESCVGCGKALCEDCLENTACAGTGTGFHMIDDEDDPLGDPFDEVAGDDDDEGYDDDLTEDTEKGEE